MSCERQNAKSDVLYLYYTGKFEKAITVFLKFQADTQKYQIRPEVEGHFTLMTLSPHGSFSVVDVVVTIIYFTK